MQVQQWNFWNFVQIKWSVAKLLWYEKNPLPLSLNMDIRMVSTHIWVKIFKNKEKQTI